MSKFKDNKNREWTILVDVPAIKALRSDLKLDIMAQDQPIFDRLAEDPILLVDTLWVLCREQAAVKGVDEIDFARGLTGLAIDHATHSLMESIADFFPPQRRALMMKALGKLKVMESKALDVMDKMLDKQDVDALMAQMETALSESTPGSTSTASVVSAESPQAPQA
jgi:hypothetical protein